MSAKIYPELQSDNSDNHYVGQIKTSNALVILTLSKKPYSKSRQAINW